MATDTERTPLLNKLKTNADSTSQVQDTRTAAVEATSNPPLSFPSILLQYHALREGNLPSQLQVNAACEYARERWKGVKEVQEFVNALEKVGKSKNDDDKFQNLLWSILQKSKEDVKEETNEDSIPTSAFLNLGIFLVKTTPLSSLPRQKIANIAKDIASVAHVVGSALDPQDVAASGETKKFVNSGLEGDVIGDSAKPSTTEEAERILNQHKEKIVETKSTKTEIGLSFQKILMIFRTFLLNLKLAALEDPESSYKSSFLEILAWIDSSVAKDLDHHEGIKETEIDGDSDVEGSSTTKRKQARIKSARERLHIVMDALPETPGLWMKVIETSSEQTHSAVVAIVRALEGDVNYLRTEGLDEELKTILDGTPLIDYCVAVTGDQGLWQLARSSKGMMSKAWEVKEKGVQGIVLGSIEEVVREVEVLPLPRLEFKSEDLEIVVDAFNLSSPAHFFVPSRTTVVQSTSFDHFKAFSGYVQEWKTEMYIHTRGIQMQARDISFYVRYKGLDGWLTIEEDGLLDLNFGGFVNPKKIVGKESNDDGFEIITQLALGKSDDKLFDLEDLDVKLTNFDYRIHDTSHPIRQMLLRPVLRPIIAFVLKNTLKSSLTSGLQTLSQRLVLKPTSMIPFSLDLPTFSTQPETVVQSTKVQHRPADRRSELTFAWAPPTPSEMEEGGNVKWTPARKKWEKKMRERDAGWGKVFWKVWSGEMSLEEVKDGLEEQVREEERMERELEGKEWRSAAFDVWINDRL